MHPREPPAADFTFDHALRRVHSPWPTTATGIRVCLCFYTALNSLALAMGEQGSLWATMASNTSAAFQVARVRRTVVNHTLLLGTEWISTAVICCRGPGSRGEIDSCLHMVWTNCTTLRTMYNVPRRTNVWLTVQVGFYCISISGPYFTAWSFPATLCKTPGKRITEANNGCRPLMYFSIKSWSGRGFLSRPYPGPTSTWPGSPCLKTLPTLVPVMGGEVATGTSETRIEAHTWAACVPMFSFHSMLALQHLSRV